MSDTRKDRIEAVANAFLDRYSFGSDATLKELTDAIETFFQSEIGQYDVLEEYPAYGNGNRVWANHASTWLYPGDKLVLFNPKTE